MERFDNEYKEKSWKDEIKPIISKYRRAVSWGAGILAGSILALNSFYVVPGGNEGVVKTFGKYEATTQEGIHGKIPLVQSVIMVNTDKVYEETFGYRQKNPGIKSEYIGVDDIAAGKVDENTLTKIIEDEGYKAGDDLQQQAIDILKDEYLMLTGDLNMADIEYSVQYKIVDAAAYLFNVKDSRKLIRDYTQSCTKTAIGDVSIDEAITIGRTMVGQEAKKKINEELDYNQSGLQVIVYKLQSTNPPTKVRDSFRSVNDALADRETKINEAKGTYNETISKAQGTAEQLINGAQGDAIRLINTAQGDVNAFKPVYDEFKRNPEITKSRIILDTYESMMQNSKNTVDLTNQNNGLLLKQLNIGGNSK
jgi:membrane protease subunit HflK